MAVNCSVPAPPPLTPLYARVHTGGIQYLQHALLSVHLHLLTIRILNGRIVLFYENALHKLHRLYARTRVSMASSYHMRTRADLPTPPEPRTTNLYSRMLAYSICEGTRYDSEAASLRCELRRMKSQIETQPIAGGGTPTISPLQVQTNHIVAVLCSKLC